MNCRALFNQRGATLLELLAALVILTLIGFSLVAFFTQSMLFTDRTEAEVDVTNLNRYVLYEAVGNLNPANAQSIYEAPERTFNDYFSFLEADEAGNYYVEGNRDQRYYPYISVRRDSVSSAQENKTIAELTSYHVSVGLEDEQGNHLSEFYELVYESELE